MLCANNGNMCYLYVYHTFQILQGTLLNNGSAQCFSHISNRFRSVSSMNTGVWVSGIALPSTFILLYTSKVYSIQCCVLVWNFTGINRSMHCKVTMKDSTELYSILLFTALPVHFGTELLHSLIISFKRVVSWSCAFSSTLSIVELLTELMF